MKKVAYIISNIDKALAFEWINDEMHNKECELYFLLLNPGKSVLEDYLVSKGTPITSIEYKGKKSIPFAFIKLIRFLRKNKIEIVHCHLFDASLLGLTAAKICGIKKRIYTRHNSTFHHDYFPKAVKYDKYINKQATHIIAISEVVKEILIDWEKAEEKKVSIINHGFKLDEFKFVEKERVTALKIKHNIPEERFVVGVISRYMHWKGIEYIIDAFKELIKINNSFFLVLANANGPYKENIQKKLQELNPFDYTEIKFENDVFALYHSFDVFVHVPINRHVEAFGQVYVESLAAGIPSVFTLSGVAAEFIEDEKNALVVGFQDSKGIEEKVLSVFNKELDTERMIHQSRNEVYAKFGLNNMIDKLKELYN